MFGVPDGGHCWGHSRRRPLKVRTGRRVEIDLESRRNGELVGGGVNVETGEPVISRAERLGGLTRRVVLIQIPGRRACLGPQTLLGGAPRTAALSGAF